MTSWTLAYDEFVAEREGLREALCTLGNGYFATRGAAPESGADGIHYPGTYLAGGYNRLTTELAGRVIENEDLVNLPNWLVLGFRIAGGDWFNLRVVEVLGYRQELDLRRGLLTRRVRFRDRSGRETTLVQRRLVHMQETHVAVLETTLTAENWAGVVTLRSALDGGVINAGVERYRRLSEKHLVVLEARAIDPETVFLKVETSQSQLRVALAARTRVYRDGAALALESRVVDEDPELIGQEIDLELAQGEGVRIEKVVTLFTSRDPAIVECGLAAREAIVRVGSFNALLRSHSLAWKRLWARFNLEMEPSEPRLVGSAARNLRLHLFHLLQTTSPATRDLDVGVPARGLHGEAYRGHIFWDELFIFPTLNLRLPELTRSLLLYRYRRLDAARALAREAGLRGAMYPWQSGSSGREESQVLHLNPRSGRWLPDHSRLQRHVNAAVAWNVWQYFQVTLDRQFLYDYGAEMLLEIARFWSSLATWNERRNRYEIKGVMGPDEYHDGYPDADRPGLDNNAYTNLMAVWVIARAVELARCLPRDRWQELCEQLAIDDGELARWEDVSRRMLVPFHGDGVLSQFEGYEALEELDWRGYRQRYGDIHRLDRILEAEGLSPNRFKASKQADVLMLFYLLSSEELAELFARLGYPFDPELIPRSVAYYRQRTAHGSTLSRVTESWVLARSDRAGSWRLFTEALESDLHDIQGGTTAEGVHLGAMAGTVDLIQRAYTGLEPRGDVLWLNPALPEALARLKLRIRYRQQDLLLDLTHEALEVRAHSSNAGPIRVGFGGGIWALEAGRSRTFRR